MMNNNFKYAFRKFDSTLPEYTRKLLDFDHFALVVENHAKVIGSKKAAFYEVQAEVIRHFGKAHAVKNYDTFKAIKSRKKRTVNKK